jgi:Tetratricopeptide repeat
MKSCPTCNRTFDDTMSFCLVDGSVLSAPYDPETGKVIAPQREPSPPRTEVMKAVPESETLPALDEPAANNSLPPIVASPSPTTIQAPPPSLPARETHQTTPIKKHSTWTQSRLLFGLGIGIVVIGVFIIFKMQSRSPNINRQSVNINVPSNVEVPSSSKETNTATGSKKWWLIEAMEKEEIKLKKQLESDPNNAKLNADLGRTLLYLGKYSEAEAILRKSIRLDPNASAPHYYLAVVLKEQKRIAESESERQKADELRAKENK